MNPKHKYYKQFTQGRNRAKFIYESKTHTLEELKKEYENLTDCNVTPKNKYYCNGFLSYIEELQESFYREAYMIETEYDTVNSNGFDERVNSMSETMERQYFKG